MKPEVKGRLTWVTLCKDIDNVGVVLRKSIIPQEALRAFIYSISLTFL